MNRTKLINNELERMSGYLINVTIELLVSEADNLGRRPKILSES